MADDFKVKIITEADTSGAKAQVRAQEEITESAKEVERETAAAAKAAEQEQKRAAKEAANAVEEAKKREIAAAKEAAKEAEKAAKEAADAEKKRRQEAASDARTVDGFSRAGANQSRAAAWAEEATRVFGDFGGKAKEATDASEGLGSGLAGLAVPAAAATVAFTTLKSALTAALDEFSVKEQAVVGLDAALANAGLLTDEYRLKLQNLANDLESSTTIGDESWIAALARLTQFGADQSNIEELAEGVKNLAGILKGDLGQAASLVSRALQGNFGPLNEYGIRVEETATQAQKLKQVLEQAAKLGGGQLEAQARSLQGQSAALGNAWGALKEGVGNLAAPAAKGFFSLMTDGLNAMANLLPGTVDKIGTLSNKQRELKETTDQATKSIEAQRSGFAGAARQAEALADAYERARRAQQGDQQRTDELMAAKQAKAEATIDAQQKAGKLTPDQASAAKDIVRQRFEKEKFDRSQQAKQEEIANRTKETDQLEKEAMDAAGRAKGSGNKDDQDEANRLSELFVRRARENAEAIESLRKDLEHEAKLFILKKETQAVQARGENIEAQRKAKEQSQPAAPGAKLAGQQADAVAQAQQLGAQAGALKGRSPEETQRLQQAANALKDGATPLEIDRLTPILSDIAAGLEKFGGKKQEDAQKVRDLEQQLKNLQGIVNRLASQQGNSGS